MTNSQGEREVIVVEQVDQIEVFVNDIGTVTIRQAEPYGEQAIVVFHPKYAAAICKAIREAAKEAREPN